MADTPVPYDRKVMPGGPWGSYRPRAQDLISALRITWSFEFTDAEGKKTLLANGGWLVQHSNGLVEAMDATTFSSTYETLE